MTFTQANTKLYSMPDMGDKGVYFIAFLRRYTTF